MPHGAPAPSPHAKRSALSVDGIINNSAAAAASASTAYAAGLQAAAAAAIGLGQLADLSAVYRQATSASDQVSLVLDYNRSYVYKVSKYFIIRTSGSVTLMGEGIETRSGLMAFVFSPLGSEVHVLLYLTAFSKVIRKLGSH